MEQIEKLATFIMAEIEGEPSQSEGAGDTAIRIIKQLQAENKRLKEAINTINQAGHNRKLGKVYQPNT